MTADNIAPTERTPCYRLGHVLIVPHFSRKGVFVGPGHCEPASSSYRTPRAVEFTEEQLKLLGAVPVTEMLWARHWS